MLITHSIQFSKVKDVSTGVGYLQIKLQGGGDLFLHICKKKGPHLLNMIKMAIKL